MALLGLGVFLEVYSVQEKITVESIKGKCEDIIHMYIYNLLHYRIVDLCPLCNLNLAMHLYVCYTCMLAFLLLPSCVAIQAVNRRLFTTVLLKENPIHTVNSGGVIFLLTL
ncbi:hypothetical protein XELAEV_18027186mg [Xenopus laevis]|uniref:Uncharacterized protein n=1 Tax=Xenopus laevis TaxID=8355 RepID=A0A974CX08_XENLA|nr:hypothetical protein XELAEV_18027186mg [Xenopus laevis]